jgi:hypothetical protein
MGIISEFRQRFNKKKKKQSFEIDEKGFPSFPVVCMIHTTELSTGSL